MTPNEIVDWWSMATKGARVVYHTGDIAAERLSHKKGDAASDARAHEVAVMADHARTMFEAGRISLHLVATDAPMPPIDKHNVGGRMIDYVAVKK